MEDLNNEEFIAEICRTSFLYHVPSI